MTTAIKHHNRTHAHLSHNDHKARHTQVAEEAEGLLDRLSLSSLSEEAKELVGRLRENVASLKESAAAAQKQIEEGFHATEKQIKQHPWVAVGVASTVGVVIGYLLRRRRE